MNKVRVCFCSFVVCIAIVLGVSAESWAGSKQTNVDQAKHSINSDGVPLLTIDGVGEVNHPAWTALYALAYAGVEDYEPKLGLKPDSRRFEATIKWLKSNLVEKDGVWVWPYNFDSTYNDVAIKAPWSSAFAQAVGIQAFLAYWRTTGDAESLVLAKRAAESLLTPIENGGLLFTVDGDVWFEEIPYPINNPSHILNGHMRSLLALSELAEATGDKQYREWFKKGSDTLQRWLPLYDSGYWLRYDLNSRKDELLFRFANPYGFSNPALAIDRIILRDPVANKEAVLDVGGATDAVGPLRIAGNDWGQPERMDGRTVRRLLPVEAGLEAADSEGQLVAPHSYFYLKLPSKWINNLRSEDYEMTVEYFDSAKGNLAVQGRSISPGRKTFQSLEDGDLLLSGSSEWRKWNVRIRVSDLGYYVGRIYANKHAQYLKVLSEKVGALKPWYQLSFGYLNTEIKDSGDYHAVVPKAVPTTNVLTLAPGYRLDEKGVVQAIQSAPDAKMLSDGSFDMSVSPYGASVYHPFVVADQLLNGDASERKKYILSGGGRIERQPALEWFLDKKNQHTFGDALTHRYGFDSSYNDVYTKAPWSSAFSQAYVIKAMLYANNELGSKQAGELVEGLVNAYSYSTFKGGLATYTRSNLPFFEEVPENTHVLNAHLISVAELGDVVGVNSAAVKLRKDALSTLHEELFKFDTGYWLKYDQNPKKSLIFNIDWLDGDQSPLIDKITLGDPQSLESTVLDVGGGADADHVDKVSGLEWEGEKVVDGHTVRQFGNGYLKRSTPAPGGLRHNAFFYISLPRSNYDNYFNILPHVLIVRYKDVAKGVFNINIQAINDGVNFSFVPLRSGRLIATGDGKWKEAYFYVRSQDMGWFKGKDYQDFELTQLHRIAQQTGDNFFAQYYERQKYYREVYSAGESPIVYPSRDFYSQSSVSSELASSPVGGLIAESELPKVNLSVLDAVSTYPGYSFDNALDGVEDDDYTATVEGLPEYQVSLKLNDALSKANVKIIFESENNFSGVVKVYESDALGNKVGDPVVVKRNQGREFSAVVSFKRAVKYVRIEFSRFHGQDRALIRLIDISRVNKAGLDLSASYLSRDSQSNPLKIFGYPITNRVKLLSDKLSHNAKSDHDKVISFMGYIDRLGVGVPGGSSPDKIIEDGVGACGEYANLLLALSAAQGIQGRYVNLYNYPVADGHTVVELKVGGKWRLYDPTYSAYYYLSDSVKQEPLSFSEIVNSYLHDKAVAVHVGNSRAGLDKFTGKAIYTQAYPSGVIGPDKPMNFPLNLELGGRSELQFAEFGPNFQGANYIGAASTNQQQDWTLSGLYPGNKYKFEVLARGVGGGGGDRKFKLKALIYDPDGGYKKIAHEFGVEGDDGRSWSIVFRAGSSSQKISLRHSYLGPQYQYLTMQGYKLTQIE